MPLVVAHIAVLFTIANAKITYIEDTYRRNPTSDRVCNLAALIYLGTTRSQLGCGKTCSQEPECTSFFFNRYTRACRGSNLVYGDLAGCDVEVGVSYMVLSSNGSDVLADCGEPPLVVNATASPGDTLQGATRNYTCDYGSDVINGSSTLVTCQENGMWTPVMFECVSPAVQVCSAPWFLVAGAGCYHTPDTNLINFTAARDYCVSQHGYLVNMETAIENELLITYLFDTYGKETWWTGLSDEGIEGTYVWSQSGTPTTYFNWASTSEPSSSTVENYIVISGNKGWADYRVDMPALALCEAG